MDLKTKIRNIPDFPKKGILFRDITTMLKDPEAFCYVIDQLTEKYSSMDIDLIAGIESRGFILGATLAYKLKKGFVPIRKPGKLPSETISVEYCLEYGTDCVEMHIDAVNSGDRVLIVDDLLATGGTMGAACDLVKRAGGSIAECCCVVELTGLNGREKLKGQDMFSMVTY